MNRTKFKITIFALALVFIFSVAAFFAVNFRNFKSANAASDLSVTVFTQSGEANVIVDRQEGKDYTLFTFGFDEDNISYRKNLAYSWYEGDFEEVEGVAQLKEVNHCLFNMEIGFKNNSFKKFVITFESQQYSKTEDNKTLNYVTFFPEGKGVKVLVTDDKDATAAESDVVLALDHITIKFDERDGDGYPVTVSDGTNSVSGKLENVGGNYAKYSSSSTTPVYPLIFSAEFGEDNEDTAQMVLYSLNNQKFEISGAYTSGNHLTGGTVTDDTPAALCLNKEISHLNIGGNISFDFQLIDVLRSSPSSTLYYHVLKSAETQKEINFSDYKGDLYSEVDSDVLLDSDKEDYLPTLDDDGGKGYGENFKIDMAVKVYAEIKDTQTNGEVSYVFLDWYVADALKLDINSASFLAVGDNKDGVGYNSKGTDWDKIVEDYQAKVDEAAKNLSAGSSSYFYVPSAETLFVDDATVYSDMRISVYYYSSTQSSNTSLATNNLSINVTNPGTYRFTLYATDAAGNDMHYYDKDGEAVEFASSEIWDIYADDDKHDYLPWFSFNVDYKGVQFKEVPGKQDTAYVGTPYTSASFQINGVENSYTTKYRLFLFDRAGYYTDMKAQGVDVDITYDWFLETMDELFAGSTTRLYFKEIKQVSEYDEDYEEFKDYNWSSSSTTFTPQEGAFYYMRAEVTDTQYNTDPVTCSLAVQASVEAKALKGDSEWLQNNVASVILLSVAGVSLIAIILLLVVRPKNKEDIDVQFEKMNKKKSK